MHRVGVRFCNIPGTAPGLQAMKCGAAIHCRIACALLACGKWPNGFTLLDTRFQIHGCTHGCFNELLATQAVTKAESRQSEQAFGTVKQRSTQALPV